MNTVPETKMNTLKEQLLESDRLLKETGHYAGLQELKNRTEDPMKYESLHTNLRSIEVEAREMARRISASPGVREVGEMVVALYTPEGDAISLSTGIMVHVHTMSRFIKCMIQNGYEVDAGIRPGDIFENNVSFIYTMYVHDYIDFLPIYTAVELLHCVGSNSYYLDIIFFDY